MGANGNMADEQIAESPVARLRSFSRLLHDIYQGQRVALICARFTYRGIVAEVGEDFIVLSNAVSVEVTGASNSEEPSTEDPINGPVTIKHDAIEILFQPRWVDAPLPGEATWEAYQNKRAARTAQAQQGTR